MSHLLWLDLETTSLDPDTGAIIEVAAVVTNMQGDIVDEVWPASRCGGTDSPWFECVVALAQGTKMMLPAGVGVMHGGAGGLLSKAIDAGEELSRVDSALGAFAGRHEGPLYLAGNSIHFDRAWLHQHMPVTFTTLHYRQIDVRSLLLAAEAVGVELVEHTKVAHRARADAKWSLGAYRAALSVLKWHHVVLERQRQVGGPPPP